MVIGGGAPGWKLMNLGAGKKKKSAEVSRGADASPYTLSRFGSGGGSEGIVFN